MQPLIWGVILPRILASVKAFAKAIVARPFIKCLLSKWQRHSYDLLKIQELREELKLRENLFRVSTVTNHSGEIILV